VVQRGDEILLTASAYDWGRQPPDHVQASAVFHSTDDGGTFRCWLKTSGSDSELLQVVWG
jgi:hypothetical protein